MFPAARTPSQPFTAREGKDMECQGRTEEGFEGVEEAFKANFARHGDVGAAFCLYVGGRKVVDIWGGTADTKTGRPWSQDTLTLVYSTTKGVTAICAHLLSQRGALDLDAPVSEYWPEFAQEGKGGVPVRWLLSHRVGLPTIERRLSPGEALAWDPAVEALAAQRPQWEPGTKHGYHALTYGWLVGEVIRRVTGRSPGRFLSEEVSRPLGLDLWVGLPEEEEHRVCRLIRADPTPLSPQELAELSPQRRKALESLARADSLINRALNVTHPPFNFNRRAVHAGELPAANGIATARSLAKLYAATIGEVDGIRLLDAATTDDATTEQSRGPDEVLVLDTRFCSGFFLPSTFAPLMGPRSFGHPGAGGSLAFADPDRQVGFAYVMNRMRQGLSAETRTAGLIEAVRQATR
jgi:CubicO group peptidase (beta-lactamase class C family)